MKRESRKLMVYSFALCIILILGACGSAPQGNAPDNVAPTAESPRQTDSVTAPAESDLMGETVTSGGSGTLECNWSLEVDDTITTKVNGYDFTCRLEICAVKNGGTDEFGTYHGTMSITYEYKMQSGNIGGEATGSGQDENVVFELTAYDKEKYTDEAGAELAPLIEYDAMSFGGFSVTGEGFSQEQAGGASWAASDTKIVSVPYQILVDAGQVTVNIPTVVSTPFSGMLTGNPAD